MYIRNRLFHGNNSKKKTEARIKSRTEDISVTEIRDNTLK